MAPSARESQQEMHKFLSKVGGDLQELSRRLEHSKQDGSRWPDIEVVLARLQQHREQIRRRSSAKCVDKVAQSKLAAARTQIEEGVRRARDLEKKLKLARSSHQLILTNSTSPGSLDPSRAAPSCTSSSAWAVSSAKVDATKTEEVKVVVEQLIEPVSRETADVTSEFVCKICQTHVVGCEPKLTRCSHLFCGDCLSKWFDTQPGCQSWAGRAKGAGSVPCPVCKEPLYADTDLHPVCKGGQGGSAFLWQMLSTTRIICANHPKCRKDGCCDWEGDYGSYQQHIRMCTNKPCHVPLLASTSVSVVNGEVVQVTGAGDTVGLDNSDNLGCEATPRTSPGAPRTELSSGASACRVAMTVSDAETERAEDDCDDSEPLAVESSKEESVITELNSAAPTAGDLVGYVNDSMVGGASEQGSDLYRLIAQLVELKATSSAPVQAESELRPRSGSSVLEDIPAPLFQEQDEQAQGEAAETDDTVVRAAHTAQRGGDFAFAKPSKSGGGKKTVGKSTDTKPKIAQEALRAVNMKAQAAELQAFQMQAHMAQAQAAYMVQWQAAWQMQAAHAAQWQQAQMAYAEHAAPWQKAQMQAARAQAARALKAMGR